MAKKQAIDIVVRAHDQASSRLRTMQKEASRVYQQTRIPAEKYRHTMSRLDGLLKRGAIGQQTYNRAVAQATARSLAAEKGVSRLGGALKRANTQLDGASKGASRYGGILKKVVGAGLAYFGGRTIIRAIGGQVTAAIEYERQIAEISTMLSGEGMKSLEVYRVGVRRMSIQFGQSTSDMGKGLYDILSAGISAGEAMEVLEVASKAAIGGMTDTAVAVDGLTTVLNAYQLSARHARRVSDVMFAIVKDGKITYTELADNIGKIAPTAKVAGMSIETLGAAIAAMVKVEKPERAMTALRAAMMHAAKEGENLLDLVRRFEGKSLTDIVGAGISKRAAAGVAILSSNMDVLNQELERFKNVSGEADEAFNKMADTRHMRMQQLKSWWESTGAVGEFFKDWVLWAGEAYQKADEMAFGDYGRGGAIAELKKVWAMPELEFKAGTKGIIKDVESVEERISMARRAMKTFGKAQLAEGGADPKTSGWLKKATATYHELFALRKKYKGQAEDQIAYEKQYKEHLETMAAARAQKDADEKGAVVARLEWLSQQQADEMKMLMERIRLEEEAAAKKTKAAEDEKKRSEETMAARAKQIKKAVMTPVQRFKAERAELGKLLSAGLLDQNQFGQALQMALKRAGKGTKDWPVMKQLAAYEARILTRGRAGDRNDPAMQQVRLQQGIAQNAEDSKKIQTETRDLIRQLANRAGLKLTFAQIG